MSQAHEPCPRVISRCWPYPKEASLQVLDHTSGVLPRRESRSNGSGETKPRSEGARTSTVRPSPLASNRDSSPTPGPRTMNIAAD